MRASLPHIRRSSLSMRVLTRPALASIALAAISLGGCQKDEQAAPGSSAKQATSPVATSKEEALLQTAVLARIPQSSVAFMVLDFEGEGYNKFKTSPWASHLQGLGSVKTAIEEMKKAGTDEGQVALFESMFNSLQKLGLVSATGESQIDKVASKVAWFVDLPPNSPEMVANAGVFIAGAKGANLKEKLSIMESVLKEQGITVAKEQLATGEGVVATLPEGADGGIGAFNKVYLGSTESLLGIARSKASLEAFLSGTAPDGLAQLRTRPEFAKSLAAIKSDDTPLSLMFASLSQATPTLEKLNAAAPEEDRIDLKSLPVDAFVLKQGIADTFTTRCALVMTPKDDTQRSVFTALEGASLPGTATGLPADAAAAISIDTKFLPKLESVLKSVQGEAAAAGFKQLSNVTGMTIALRNNDGGSPVPDVFIGLEAANRDDLSKILEAAIGQGMAATGAPGAQWQTKEVNGASVRYFTTLLGVGVYVAAPANSKSLLVSSSERAMKDFLGAVANGPTSLAGALKGSIKDRLLSAKLASTYVNFDQLATLIDSVKGSLAMLTGGSSEVDKALDTKALRAWGVHAGSVAFSEGTLKIDASFDQAAK